MVPRQETAFRRCKQRKTSVVIFSRRWAGFPILLLAPPHPIFPSAHADLRTISSLANGCRVPGAAGTSCMLCQIAHQRCLQSVSTCCAHIFLGGWPVKTTAASWPFGGPLDATAERSSKNRSGWTRGGLQGRILSGCWTGGRAAVVSTSVPPIFSGAT